jgi:hypothetical protein
MSFIAGFSSSAFFISDLQPEATINVNRTEGDISQVNNIEPPRYNYIQANNHDVNYTWTGDEVTVEDVDQVIEVHGSSMRPTSFTGHKGLAKEYSNQSLSEGMIVVTKENVMHRIEADYSDTDGYYMIRGDNAEDLNRVEDEDIDYVVIGMLYDKQSQ